MFKWTDVFMQEEHAKELRREAEQERLARQLPHTQSSLRHAYWQIVDTVGAGLVNIGCRLRDHVEKARPIVARRQPIGPQPSNIRPCAN